MLDIGDIYQLKATFKDSAGAVSDPTTITLVVQAPSGKATYTYADAEITRESAGVYSKDLTLDAAGIWPYRWTSTGTPETSEEGEFEVRERVVT